MIGPILAAAALALATAPTTTAAPPLATLDGAPARPAPKGRVLLFWRADCAPCLLELSDLKALRAAARPLELQPVGLQEPGLLRTALLKRGLRTADSLATPEEPSALLTRLAGAPPRLPVAVAYRADGSLCGTHSGLLGRDQVRAWAHDCEAPRAAR